MASLLNLGGAWEHILSLSMASCPYQFQFSFVLWSFILKGVAVTRRSWSRSDCQVCELCMVCICRQTHMDTNSFQRKKWSNPDLFLTFLCFYRKSLTCKSCTDMFFAFLTLFWDLSFYTWPLECWSEEKKIKPPHRLHNCVPVLHKLIVSRWEIFVCCF